MEPIALFSASYMEARKRFIEAAEATGFSIYSEVHPVAGPAGTGWVNLDDEEEDQPEATSRSVPTAAAASEEACGRSAEPSGAPLRSQLHQGFIR